VILSEQSTTPGQLLPLTEDLAKRVCRLSGIEPNKLAKYGSPKAGWFWAGIDPTSKPVTGLRRKILIAYAQHAKRKNPLCIRGNRGWYGLTDAGHAEALRLIAVREEKKQARLAAKAAKPAVKPTENATSRFLSAALAKPDSKLLNTMHRYVAKNMPVSATVGVIDDHINNCFVKLIARDALAGRIAAGSEIKDHHVATWAVRSAYGDIRSDGTEPVTREMYGARTDRERRSTIKEVTDTISDPRVIFAASGEDGSTGSSWADIADTDSSFTAGAAEDRVQFDQVWKQVEEITLASRKPAEGRRNLSILRMRAAGLSTKEIADKQGISLCSANNLIARVRDVILEGFEERGITV
jgi:DNA-directed RNA polymerase specialized sigma24 family protein